MAAGAFTVNAEVRIEAPPEAVFPFLTEPDKIVRWKGVDATVEAAPGGVYRVNVTGEKHAVGEYVEIDPPRRVVFTWGWEGETSSSRPAPPPSRSSSCPTARGPSSDSPTRGCPRGRTPPSSRAGTTSSRAWRRSSRAAIPGPDPWVSTQMS